uniref:CPBP family intramembrane glutamic endopeptidase n=2 Tax=unclassified Microbacterium TaxID=2609290 RepID=UPI0028A65703
RQLIIATKRKTTTQTDAAGERAKDRITAGASLATIAFEVAFLAAAGASSYWVRRVTGRLWVAILVHAFTDWALYLASGAGTPAASLPQAHSSENPDPFQATFQTLLRIATTISLVSIIREDRLTRREMRV